MPRRDRNTSRLQRLPIGESIVVHYNGVASAQDLDYGMVFFTNLGEDEHKPRGGSVVPEPPTCLNRTDAMRPRCRVQSPLPSMSFIVWVWRDKEVTGVRRKPV